MNEADRYKIISENYADIILDDWNREEVRQKFSGDLINHINSDIAFAYIPVDRMTLDSINQFGYYSMPGCYGLLTAEINHECLLDPKPQGFEGYDGKGVLLGFVDTGIDYRHPAFRKKDNTTRIASIWDQSIRSRDNHPRGLYYGTEYSKEQINLALQSSDPLSVIPVTDDIGHGTIMAGIACGSEDKDNHFQGVASEAELVIVKLKPAKQYLRELYIIPDGVPCYQENDIIAGVEYLDRIASSLNRPIIICIGIGNNIVDHVGLRISSRFYTSIGEKPGYVFITAAGNEANRKNHYYESIAPEAITADAELHVGKKNPGFMMQFWGQSPNFFWIDVYMPSGDFLMRIPPVDGQTKIEKRDNGLVVADSALGIPSNHNQSIIFRFHNPMEGNWTFSVFGSMGDLPREFHFWLSLHNFLAEDTYFIKPNNYTTIVGPANSAGLLTVTSYDVATEKLDFYSSRGFNVDQFPKPDVAAPGVNLPAPFPGGSYVSASGSSVAAAYTAGITALVLQWGEAEDKADFLNTPHVKHIYQLSALRDEDMKYPNEDWGYGILNPQGILDVLKELMAL
ncbi:S8 family peptidase [Anaerocolumna xylanovorans]|uniref:Subtilase family protein n=1 Tax=Anaerocolumna xylanovorans DSM 12503 TaxID=1121345 RepID=A0A1M7YGY6_9FIRM|nr:S8 family peptidase [Anaerocolumna xylanovorans]SHO51892.1 Subtilase family protein [Anaerocolumna xylanovorans DSM 12503]